MTAYSLAADDPGAGGRVWPGRRARAPFLAIALRKPPRPVRSRTAPAPGAGGNPPQPLQTPVCTGQAHGIPAVPGTAGTRLWRGGGTALLFIHRPSRGFPAFTLARGRNQTPPPKPAGERQQFRGGGQRQTVPPPGWNAGRPRGLRRTTLRPHPKTHLPPSPAAP